MIKAAVGDEILQDTLKLKIRLDYRGENRPGKFFFGGKNIERVAEEVREQRVALLRNVPLQGVTIEDIDVGADIYTVFDETSGVEVAYAPVILTARAESIQDALRLIMREEFRKVEILEPDHIYLNRSEIERLLFSMNEELQHLRGLWERRAGNR
ncbi:MAG: hypothetical protein ACYC2T_09480 [Bacillota bacterium]